MGASPRSMWSGLLRLGLLNAPVTIGKAWSDEREKGLRDLCAAHKIPVNRTERCDHPGCELESKVKGVEKPNGAWHPFGGDEIVEIEEATKSDTLDVLDVQPTDDLPLPFGTGSYFVRPDKKVGGSAQVFALLAEALNQTGYGLVVKWCTSSRQKLAVLHAVDGIILLTTVPMAHELRIQGDQEEAHFAVETDDAQVSMLVDLLDATRSESYDHSRYEDEGLKLRQAAVERVLAGKKGKAKKKAPVKQPVDNIMATLQASIDKQKKEAAKA